MENPCTSEIFLNVSDPANPVILSLTELQGSWGSSLAFDEDGTSVFVGTPEGVEVYALLDPSAPQFAGRLEGLGGGEVAIAEGVLVSAGQGAVKTAALSRVISIREMTASGVIFEQGNPVSETDITIPFGVTPSDIEISSAQVEIFKNDQLLENLPAQVTGPTGIAVWPARRPVDLKATYFARAVIEPGSRRELRSAPRQVPIVHLVFVDKRGEETFAPLMSNPRPVVTLDDVLLQDVELLDEGRRARVTIRGEVTDATADIVPNHAADITRVVVQDQPFAVVPVPEPASVTRPFAFRGRFSATVTVGFLEGGNTVVVEAENAIGNRGVDSFTVNLLQTVNLVEAQSTGSVYHTKFLDPFTLALSPLRPDTADSVVLIHGAGVPTGSETGLVETALDSLVFTGTTTELGFTTLTLDAPLSNNDPSVLDAVSGVLSTSGLAIFEQRFEFVETSAGSGLFRNPALRLPNNERMEIALDQQLDPLRLDTVRVRLGTDPDEEAETLNETAPESGLFIGRVAGLGETTVRVQALQELVGEPDLMLVFLTSSDQLLTDFYLKLFETEEGSLRFQTHIGGPASIVVPPAEPTRSVLVGVENHASSDGGLFEPTWVVARGLSSFQPADQGEINRFPMALTNRPGPQKASVARAAPVGLPRVPEVRFELPLLFTRTADQLQGKNVTNVVQAVGDPSQDEMEPRHFMLSISASSQELVARREASSALLTKLVAIRGRRMELSTSFVTGSSVRVTGLSILGSGVSVKLISEKVEPLVSRFNPGLAKVTTTFEVKVNSDEPVGLKDLTYHLSNGDSTTFPGAFEISRGRVVIFAIDGLSNTQLRAVVNDETPELDAGRPGTALSRIFGNHSTRPDQKVIGTVSTTFPPMTFTRWASIFSGKPPGQTRVPALQWLNRQALINPAGDHGSPNQFLGLNDPRMMAELYMPLVDAGAYNRHFKENFIYDNLRSRGFRSIVINQQAGLGKGNSGNRGDDRWLIGDFGALSGMVRLTEDRVRNEGLGDLVDVYLQAKTLVPQEDLDFDTHADLVWELVLSDAMDRNSVRTARKETDRTQGDFDLMVIYLPGLDHMVHAFGTSGGQGERWFREGMLGKDIDTLSLHGRINEVVRALGGLKQSTVFGIFSDHGHYDTHPRKNMELDTNGNLVNALPWRMALQVNDRLAVGDRHKERSLADRLFLKPGVNVIFDPQFGMANIYVAGRIESVRKYDWTKPPSVKDLEPIVNSIHDAFVLRGQVLDDWEQRPVADILVRVSPNPDSFVGSYYKVVPRNYNWRNCEGCSLESQLLLLSSLDGLGYGNDPGETWSYSDPERRVSEWISPNSGDIVVLANGRYGYQFAKGYRGNHGSLTSADSVVPVAFGYPGATGGREKDDTLEPILSLIEDFGAERIKVIVETQALESFFGIPKQ